MFEDEQRGFLEKYERNIREIIEKYKDVDDRYDSVISINEYEDIDTSVCNGISFIRQSASGTMACEGIIGFEDVYARLCLPCDFDDISYFLQ